MFVAFEVRAFPICSKMALLFSNDIVSPINLIKAIIINYQLSIKRSALEKKMVEQKH